jgi:transketolase
MRKTPGVDMTSGSLGQGFACAVGQALAGKLDRRSFRVYVMLGDSEMQCGLVWEAAQAAAHYQLDNLVAIVDDNRLQNDGPTEEIMRVQPLPDKWRAFGWEVRSCPGHAFPAIHEAFQGLLAAHGQPKVLIAETLKGKGVSFMEGAASWHSGAPNPQQAEAALREILSAEACE